MMMVMMRVCWPRGPEEVRLLGFFTEFAVLSFFLWDPQAQCLTVSKFCFVLLLLVVETNFVCNQFYVSDYYFFLVNLMRILGSCLLFSPLSLELDSADLFFLENFSPEMSSLLLSGDLKNWVLLG
jgi:hypothetical protein